VELVIFDCDGVMFDSRRANEAFYNHIRSHFGLPPMNLSEVDYVHMATAEQSVNHIMPDDLRDDAQQVRLATDYHPFYSLMEIEPHLITVLETIRPHCQTAVATNRSNTISPLLDEFGLTPYFDIVVSSTDVLHPKPHPECLLLILRRLGISADRALFIGDAVTDAQAARQAGVRLVAYGNRKLEARYHIDRLDQLIPIVLDGGSNFVRYTEGRQ
jgi:phosphoglycolate phosphatase